MFSLRAKSAIFLCAFLFLTGTGICTFEAATSFADVADEIIKLTNDERAKNGLPALSKSNALTWIAQKHSQNMAAISLLSHDSTKFPAGWQTTVERLAKVGLKAVWWAENVHMHTPYGQNDAQKTVDGWINSPKHHANMLNSHVKYIGAGFAGGYATQVFCSEPGTMPTGADTGQPSGGTGQPPAGSGQPSTQGLKIEEDLWLVTPDQSGKREYRAKVMDYYEYGINEPAGQVGRRCAQAHVVAAGTVKFTEKYFKMINCTEHRVRIKLRFMKGGRFGIGSGVRMPKWSEYLEFSLGPRQETFLTVRGQKIATSRVQLTGLGER